MTEQPDEPQQQAPKGSLPNNRPTWDEYFMRITKEVAERSTCMSAKLGAIIVKEGRIISSGYNGAPRKTKDSYEWGFCLRRHLKIPSGQRYELCRSVHAEQNAIINAARAATSPVDSDIYIYGAKIIPGENAKDMLIDAFPCFICKKMIINAGIKRVICSTKDGKIKSFSVDEDWIREWKSSDMIDDMVKYDTPYYQKNEQKNE